MSGGFANFAFEDWLEVAERRKAWIALGAGAGLLIGTALYLLWPPSYEARTTVLVEPQEVPETYIKSTITLNYEQRLSTLRQRVTSFDSMNALVERIGPAVLDPGGKLTREQLIGRVRGNLSVERENTSSQNVFDVTYRSSDPELAATVARELTAAFIAENQKDRTEQAAETAEFLDKELERLREEVADQEEKVRSFRFERMGSLPEQLDANLRGLDRMNLELATNLEAQVADSQRIALMRQQLDETHRRSPGPVGSPSDLQTMLANARRRLVETELIYTTEHPNVKQLRDEIAELERRLDRDPQGGEPASRGAYADPAAIALKRQIQDAQMTLDARKREEKRIRDRIDELQARVEQTPKREQELHTLTRDYENLTTTYRNLLSKKYEASLARNLELAQKGERFKVLQPPAIPGSPSWPDPLILLPGGLAVGLVLSILAVLFVELRNPAFHSVTRLARLVGLPVVASIPRIDRDEIYEEPPGDDVDPKLVVHTAPESSPAEQYRGFLPTLIEAEDCSVLLVTSAARGDGKTLTCVNLAASIAVDLNRRVLIIDGDLRRPAAHRVLRVPRKRGLSDVLAGRAVLEDCALNSKVPNLSLLPAGPSVRKPLALLTNERFLDLLEEAKQQYDLVIIDSPPLLPVVDTKILRRIANMVLFVVRADGTPPEAVLRSLAELKGVAGIVFNQVSPGSFRRYYYYDAYSRYAYGDDVVEDKDV